MENSIKTIERFCKIHQLIQQGRTGSPDELAAYFQISRRTLYRILEELKDRGISVKYSRGLGSFYYSNHLNGEVTQLLLSEFKGIMKIL